MAGSVSSLPLEGKIISIYLMLANVLGTKNRSKLQICSNNKLINESEFIRSSLVICVIVLK